MFRRLAAVAALLCGLAEAVPATQVLRSRLPAEAVLAEDGGRAPLADGAATAQEDPEERRGLATPDPLGNTSVSRPRSREARSDADAALEELTAYEREAWTAVFYARKLGPHRPVSRLAQSPRGLGALFASAPASEWGFLAAVLLGALRLDATALQQLPELPRLHAVLLFFWLLLALAYSVEVWLRLGQQAGVAWVEGYVLEIIFSADKVFVVHLLFCSFETPRRLTTRALYVALMGSIALRFALLLGLAGAMDRLAVVPYALGVWLVYCGTKQVTAHEDETADVTQSALVRTFRGLLGERLGEFYDEDEEALVAVQKGRYCLTLLGVVVLCLLSLDFLSAFDVVLTKAEELDNAYLSISSSAMALFAVRAVYFVARDLLHRPGAVRYGLGLVLLFMGAEALLSRAVYVNALMSCLALGAIVAASLTLAWLRGPGPKAAQ